MGQEASAASTTKPATRLAVNKRLAVGGWGLVGDSTGHEFSAAAPFTANR
jgi:hypothetical protein